MRILSFVLFVIASGCAFVSVVGHSRNPVPQYLADYPELRPVTSEQDARDRYWEWVAYIKKHVQPRLEEYKRNRPLMVKYNVYRLTQEKDYMCDGPYGVIYIKVDNGFPGLVRLAGIQDKLLGTKKKPKITLEDAIKRAEEYARKFMLDFDKFGYRFTTDDSLSCFAGHEGGAMWSLTALRWVDGYEAEPTLSVDLEEDAGFYLFAGTISMPPVFTEQKLSKEQALEIAGPAAEKMLENASGDAWSGWGVGFKITKLKSMELEVVTPTNLHEPGVNSNTWRLGKENRLAWVAKYSAEHETEKDVMPMEIRIYVDAGTGKVIGGGF
jgi:hypothetical protein